MSSNEPQKELSLSNVDAATKIFVEHGDYILKVLRYQTSNIDLIDDLYQDLFLYLAVNPIPDYVTNVRGYLFRAIINDIIDRKRSIAAYRSLLTKYFEKLNETRIDQVPENELIEAEETHKLFTFIRSRLRKSESQAIIYRYRNGLSPAETSDKMKITEGAVRRYTSIGIKKLKEFLSESEADKK